MLLKRSYHAVKTPAMGVPNKGAFQPRYIVKVANLPVFSTFRWNPSSCPIDYTLTMPISNYVVWFPPFSETCAFLHPIRQDLSKVTLCRIHVNNLKENAPMDIIASMTLTQSLLFWILLGFLLIWMVTCAVLAFLSKVAEEDGGSDIHNVPGDTPMPLKRMSRWTNRAPETRLRRDPEARWLMRVARPVS